MFENQTFENIMERMLSKVSPTLDRREGSIIYDALAPAAAEMCQLYAALGTAMEEFFIDSASFEYLKKHGENYLLAPQEATASVVIGEFEPNNADVLGKTFSAEGMNFVAESKYRTLPHAVQYRMRCTAPGEAGNIEEGNLIPVEEIKGLTSAKIVSIAVLGGEEESCEEFRSRLISHIGTQPFGGNVEDYTEKILAMDGVGKVKVIPCNDGERTAAGHVLIKLLDYSYEVPTEELCENVKKELMGGGTNGGSYGLAPIGHIVHVEAPGIKEIGVKAAIFFYGNDQTGAAFDESTKVEIAKQAKEAIEEYFAQLINEWFESANAGNLNLSTHRLIAALLTPQNTETVWRIVLNIDGEETMPFNMYVPGNFEATVSLGDNLPKLMSCEIEFGEHPS